MIMDFSAPFEQRFRLEIRKAYVNAFLINTSLVYYFLFSLYYLLSSIEVGGAWFAKGLLFNYALGLVPVSLGLAWLWTRSAGSTGRVMVESTHPLFKAKSREVLQGWWGSPSGIFSSGIILLTVVLGWILTQVSFYDLFSYDGVQGAKRIFMSLLTPEASIIDIVVRAMIETIFIAFMSTILSIPPAFITAFLSSRNLMQGSAFSMGVYNFFRFIFNFARSVEPLIWAIIFSVWVGIGPFAGMLALMLHSIASLAKMYSEQIECIDEGPLEAIAATGANKIQVIWYAVVPQIVLPFLSFTIFRWDINIRMATIIGLVGGGGVGTLLMQYQGLAKWNEVGTIIIVIALVVWIMDYLSAKIREAIK